MIFVLHKAAAEDLNNNQEPTDEPEDEQQTEMDQEQPADQVSEKLDTLNEKPSSKKPKKKSRKWYRIFTICIIPAKKEWKHLHSNFTPHFMPKYLNFITHLFYYIPLK